jgi:hypothetical protein
MRRTILSAGIPAGRAAVLLAAALAAPPANSQPALPAALAMDGRAPLLVLQAVGAQVYACTADEGGKSASWRFREPIATLMEGGKTVGRHYAGPSWALDDGSAVTGKLLASAPGATPADVPQLKLAVATHRGAGWLADATTVLRLDTRGGALTGACATPGDLRAQPYSATYAFYR